MVSIAPMSPESNLHHANPHASHRNTRNDGFRVPGAGYPGAPTSLPAFTRSLPQFHARCAVIASAVSTTHPSISKASKAKMRKRRLSSIFHTRSFVDWRAWLLLYHNHFDILAKRTSRLIHTEACSGPAVWIYRLWIPLVTLWSSAPLWFHADVLRNLRLFTGKQPQYFQSYAKRCRAPAIFLFGRVERRMWSVMQMAGSVAWDCNAMQEMIRGGVVVSS